MLRYDHFHIIIQNNAIVRNYSKPNLVSQFSKGINLKFQGFQGFFRTKIKIQGFHHQDFQRRREGGGAYEPCHVFGFCTTNCLYIKLN